MDIEQHIENLKKYIEEDFAFREPLKNYSDFDRFCYNHCKDIDEVLKRLAKVERQNKIKNEYLKMIYALGVDYDGCHTIESLKELIDELMDYALKAIKNDDKTTIDIGNRYNILLEDIRGKDKVDDIKKETKK